MKIKLMVLLCVFLSGVMLNAQEIVGSWVGTLDVGAPLRIVFNISVDENRHVKATMDSPDQGAFGINVDEVIIDSGLIELKLNSLKGFYKGDIKNADLIEGSWTQSGQNFPLNLKKTNEKIEIKRPQTPKEPFPNNSVEVEFKNEEADIILAGTFTFPKEKDDFPAVIMVTGSGAQDRDETIFNHKPFAVIADHLTKNGIAVLRYDDRGFGKSGGDFVSATTEDFAGDAIAAYEYLLQQKNVNKNKIGVIGHSEGGLIASILGSQLDDLDFIVLLASPGVSGDKILSDQVRDINIASGLDDEVVKSNVRLQEKILAIVKEQIDENTKREKLKELVQNDAQVNQLLTPWFKFFVSFDPQDVLREISSPVLALNGDKDLQVNSKRNLKEIKSALEKGGNKNFKTLELKNLNHLFQNCETGMISEYGKIEETFAPEVLDIITNWINEL
ncbi:MAG: alpha/beta fold hydrolase [Melioribacteraceae bacterium]|nr:alpha/beta fold hydrolase [Melioribacteraceae bacterium]